MLTSAFLHPVPDFSKRQLLSALEYCDTHGLTQKYSECDEVKDGMETPQGAVNRTREKLDFFGFHFANGHAIDRLLPPNVGVLEVVVD